MTEVNPALWLQGRTDHAAVHYRRLLEAITVTPGVFGNGLAVSEKSGTPNMSVDVAAGFAVVPGSQSATQGHYFVDNDAVKNLTVAAADATNPRKDRVVAKVEDAAYSGATSAWSLAVVTGTPAASPSEPALPANSVELALINVAAGAASITNANLTDRRVRLARPVSTIGWTLWTPTWSGITVGNGTNIGRYRVERGMIFWQAQLTLGSTSNVTAVIELHAPAGVTVDTSYAGRQLSAAIADDASQRFSGTGLTNAGDRLVSRFAGPEGQADTAVANGWGSSSPMTWANGDILSSQGWVAVA